MRLWKLFAPCSLAKTTNGKEQTMARIDILPIVEKVGSKCYRDFEGLANPKQALKACKVKTYSGEEYIWDNLMRDLSEDDLHWRETVRTALRSIILNLVFEYIDHCDESPTETEVWELGQTVFNMLTCREWVAVSEDEIKEMEQEED